MRNTLSLVHGENTRESMLRESCNWGNALARLRRN